MLDAALAFATDLPIQVWIVVGLAVAVVFRGQVRALLDAVLAILDDLVGLQTVVVYLVVIAAGVLFGRRVLPSLLTTVTGVLPL